MIMKQMEKEACVLRNVIFFFCFPLGTIYTFISFSLHGETAAANSNRLQTLSWKTKTLKEKVVAGKVH